MTRLPSANRPSGEGESTALKRGAIAAVLVSLLLHGSVWQLLRLAPMEQPEPPVIPPQVMEVSLVSAPAPKPSAPVEPPKPKPVVQPAQPKPPAPPPQKKVEKPKPKPKLETRPERMPEPIEEAERPDPESAPSSKTAESTKDTSTNTAAKPEASAPPAGDGKPAVDNTYKQAGWIRHPRYPPMAQERGWSGTVKLKLHLLADGTVREAQIESSSGHELLDKSVLDQVKSEKMINPSRRGDKPIDDWVIISIQFNLKPH